MITRAAEKSPNQYSAHLFLNGARYAALSFCAAVVLLLLFIGYGSIPNRWYRVLYVTSGSMAPAIHSGDLVIVVPPPARLEPGMVLTIAVNGELVTHRLAAIGPGGELVTRGDGNSAADVWVGAQPRVVGVVRGRIPMLGYALQARPFNLQGAATGAWFYDTEILTASFRAGEWVFKTPAPTAAPAKLNGSFTLMPFYLDGNSGVDVRVCLSNSGSVRVDGLRVKNIIQASSGAGQYQDIAAEYLDTGKKASLEPGETSCYEGRVKFSPIETGRYRNAIQVTTAESLSHAAVLDLFAEFVLPISPTAARPTATLALTQTPAAPVMVTPLPTATAVEVTALPSPTDALVVPTLTSVPATAEPVIYDPTATPEPVVEEPTTAPEPTSTEQPTLAPPAPTETPLPLEEPLPTTEAQ